MESILRAGRTPTVPSVVTPTTYRGAMPVSIRVQFLRNGLAAHLDFALVLASGRKIVGNLHPQPCFRRAAERLGQPDCHYRADAGR
ncbi:hypothetical protein SBA4_930018 [Candidatus Sulfopaludibacter sp. SbA4]|nr:hypothetical protein SBA4_930018 [Candidatus Sulfopaludibacter sp. SbA4]